MTFLKNIFTCFLLCFVITCGSDYKPDLFAIPYYPELDITKQAQIITVGPLKVKVDVNRPIKPFQHQYFRLSFSENSKVIEVSNPKLTFNMKMDMGRLIFMPELKTKEYVADVHIPKCIYGDIRWYGKLEFEYKGTPYSKVFLFDMP